MQIKIKAVHFFYKFKGFSNSCCRTYAFFAIFFFEFGLLLADINSYLCS